MRIGYLLKRFQLKIKARVLPLKTHYLRIFKISDLDRWSNVKNLKEDWNERTIMISELIDEGLVVLEFGAGRLTLKNHLRNCKYIPSDLVDRGENTIVCDLNRELPNIPEVDVIVFSGVLEYIHDLEKLISFLSLKTSSFVLSYAVSDYNKNDRRRHGWVNDYSKIKLESIFESNGFKLEQSSRWEDQIINKFISNL